MKFGYAAAVEKEAIRKRLLEEGHPDDFTLYFKVQRAYEEAHKNDPSYAETSRAFAAKWAAVHAKNPRGITFTVEELMNLIERYDLANDPISQSILSKLLEALPKDDSDVPVPATS